MRHDRVGQAEKRLTAIEEARSGRDEEIAEIREGLAGVIAAQSATATNLDRLVESVRSLETRLAQPPPATNWTGIGVLILGVVGAVATLGKFSIDTVTRQQDADHQQLVELQARSDAGGASRDKTDQWYLEWLRGASEEILKIKERELENAYLRGKHDGRLESLEKQMRDIDSQGSRRWVKRLDE